jgi:hypothetical protein
MMSRRSTHSDLNGGRRDPVSAHRRAVDGALGGGSRLDDLATDAEPRARPMTTCPVCESPVFVDAFCMNCWEVC